MKVRYSRDCDILSDKIYSVSHCKLSASTLRRLFGFIKGTKEARAHTLDVISNYLGYSTWDDLIETLDNSGNSSIKIITELKSSKLKVGDKYQYLCKPDVEVTLEYIGKSRFQVLAAKNSQLQQNDIFIASVLSLHRPLFILEVERNGKPLGKVIEAKVSGITVIRKL